MAKGSQIIITANPRGVFLEGVVEGTPKPGTYMEIKPGASPTGGGRLTFRVYQAGANGNRSLPLILLPNTLQGKTEKDAYTSGVRGYAYVPVPGEELNVLVKNIAGTSDVFSVGDVLVPENGTGLFVKATGSEQTSPFIVIENIGPLTEDTLVAVIFTGY